MAGAVTTRPRLLDQLERNSHAFTRSEPQQDVVGIGEKAVLPDRHAPYQRITGSVVTPALSVALLESVWDETRCRETPYSFGQGLRFTARSSPGADKPRHGLPPGEISQLEKSTTDPENRTPAVPLSL